jgi:hypothetical protein
MRDCAGIVSRGHHGCERPAGTSCDSARPAHNPAIGGQRQLIRVQQTSTATLATPNGLPRASNGGLPAPTIANDLAAESSHRGGQGFKSPQLHRVLAGQCQCSWYGRAQWRWLQADPAEPQRSRCAASPCRQQRGAAVRPDRTQPSQISSCREPPGAGRSHAADPGMSCVIVRTP